MHLFCSFCGTFLSRANCTDTAAGESHSVPCAQGLHVPVILKLVCNKFSLCVSIYNWVSEEGIRLPGVRVTGSCALTDTSESSGRATCAINRGRPYRPCTRELMIFSCQLKTLHVICLISWGENMCMHACYCILRVCVQVCVCLCLYVCVYASMCVCVVY